LNTHGKISFISDQESRGDNSQPAPDRNDVSDVEVVELDQQDSRRKKLKVLHMEENDDREKQEKKARSSISSSGQNKTRRALPEIPKEDHVKERGKETIPVDKAIIGKEINGKRGRL